MLRNIYSGEILLEKFLKPMTLSQNALTYTLGTTEQFWMGLQMDYNTFEMAVAVPGLSSKWT